MVAVYQVANMGTSVRVASVPFRTFVASEDTRDFRPRGGSDSAGPAPAAPRPRPTRRRLYRWADGRTHRGPCGGRGVKLLLDVKVVVATPETLYKMKRDTIRLQDKADAQKLKQKLGLED